MISGSGGMKTTHRYAVDANCIISAVIGGGTRRIFYSPKVSELATTEYTIREVARYLPHLAVKRKLNLLILQFTLNILPVTVYPDEYYRPMLAKAYALVGSRDCKDVDILALAMIMDCPVLTNDNHILRSGYQAYTAAQLLKIIK